MNGLIVRHAQDPPQTGLTQTVRGEFVKVDEHPFRYAALRFLLSTLSA